MRFRFSPWDVAVALGFALEVAAAVWLMDHLRGPVPLHWGLSGQPDRFGEPSWVGLLIGPVIAVAVYVTMRLVDSIYAVRRPEYYGFLTTLGGGMALFLLMLGGLIQWSTWRQELALSPMPLLALMFAFMGWQFLSAEDIPVNTGGLFADTRENRDIVRRTLGKGFIATGLTAFALAWLPGPWALLALAVFLVGPLATIVATLLRCQA